MFLSNSSFPLRRLGPGATEASLDMSRDGFDWTREEVVLVLDLYRRRGPRVGNKDKDVRGLAKLFCRSAGAIVYKLGNLRAVESEGRSGFTHFTHLDLRVWHEFENHLEDLRREADRLRLAFPWTNR